MRVFWHRALRGWNGQQRPHETEAKKMKPKEMKLSSMKPKKMKPSSMSFSSVLHRRWLSLPVWFWSVMLTQAIVRFALMLPRGLLHDEAYYWFWGRDLQLSYYDNPPGAGWFLAPFLWLFGDEAWVLRLAAGLFGLFATYCAARLVCDLIPSDSARLDREASLEDENEVLGLFSVFVLGTISFWGLFAFWTHDIGCTAFAFFGIWMAVRALKDGQTRWWLLAGLGLGLSLLGKYTAGLWIAASALFVLWDAEARRSLQKRAPWGALLIASLALLPILVWNYQNDWVSFQFVSNRHLNTSNLTIPERMLNLLEYAAIIVVAVGIPFCLALVRFVRNARASKSGGKNGGKKWWNSLPIQQRYVFFVSACVLGFFTITAWKKGTYINWAIFPTMLFATGCVALGSAGWRDRLKKPLVLLAMLLAMLPSSLLVALYAASMLSGAWMPKGTFDQVYGWDEVYETIVGIQRDSFPQHEIAGLTYQLASKLAHSGCVEGDCRRSPEITPYYPSQFNFTYPSLAKWKGKDFLLLMPTYIRKEDVGTLFCSIVLAKEVERRVAGKTSEKFKLYDARYFLGRKGDASSCPR